MEGKLKKGKELEIGGRFIGFAQDERGKCAVFVECTIEGVKKPKEHAVCVPALDFISKFMLKQNLQDLLREAASNGITENEVMTKILRPTMGDDFDYANLPTVNELKQNMKK